MIDTDSFRAGMRRLAAGVSIISAAGDNGPCGITATAVTSLAAAPPSVLCCVNKSLYLADAIRSTGHFGINVLRSEHQDLALRFAGMDAARGPEKFDAGAWTQLPSGVPGLADSLVTFDCQADQVVEVSTHYIVIGLIERVTFGEPGHPLVYCDGEFSSLRSLAA